MHLRLTIEQAVLTARLLDNDTSRDFASLLPLTLTLGDFHATEKISDLPRRLSATDASPGTDAEAGDIAYYAPWGNLALFYRDSEYAPGLVKLGTIDSGTEILAAIDDEFTVTIDIADGDTA